MKMIKSLSVMMLAATLAACAVTGSQEVVKPKAQKSGFMGLSTTANVTVDGPKAFTGQNKVVIGSFHVAFIDSKKEAEKAGTGFGGRSSAKLELQGVTPEVRQAITDAAYADLLAQLQAAGYEVADRSVLLNSPEFSKTKKENSPFVKEASFFGSANNMNYVAPRAIGDVRFFNGENGLSGGLGFSNPAAGASMFADKNKLPVIAVAYTIDFAAKDGSGGRWASTSSLEVGQALTVIPGSGINFIGGQGGTFSTAIGSLKLGQPITSPDKYGEVVMTTSGAMKSLEVATNVLGVMMGAGTNQSRDFVIKADPAKYRDGSIAILKQANSDLLGKMASLK